MSVPRICGRIIHSRLVGYQKQSTCSHKQCPLGHAPLLPRSHKVQRNQRFRRKTTLVCIPFLLSSQYKRKHYLVEKPVLSLECVRATLMDVSKDKKKLNISFIVFPTFPACRYVMHFIFARKLIPKVPSPKITFFSLRKVKGNACYTTFCKYFLLKLNTNLNNLHYLCHILTLRRWKQGRK